jgi:diketogulonate reductase-like aldo/keto reductase
MELTLDSAVTLNDCVRLPMLGLGVYQVAPGKETFDAVSAALKAGYRHIDTARFYGNEKDVGRAVRESGLPRDQVFVTTKLWNSDHGYDAALRAFDASLADLGLDRIDLYLIHWPVKGKGQGNVPGVPDAVSGSIAGLRAETWRALEQIRASGRCLAIGVSNYTIRHLRQLLDTATVVPAVNQVEFSPFLFQRELLDFCIGQGIQLEAYSPLTRGRRLTHPTLVRMAGKYARTAAQILVRWALQHQLVALPKSTRPERILENSQVFDFALSPDDMRKLDALNENLHLCWDPTDAP